MTLLDNPTTHLKKEKPPAQLPGSSTTAIATASYFSGPIPPPEFLKQYEELVPGIAKRFLEEPRLEAEHRRSLEKRMVEEKIRLATKGQWMAFTLALLSIAAAFTAIFLGYSLAGFATFLVAATGFAGAFIISKKHQS